MIRPLLFSLVAAAAAMAQQLPPVYMCGRVDTPLVIDGKGDEPTWKQARELTPFKDIEGGTIPHQCRVKMLWDDDYLYILADMDEQHLWATRNEHDSIIYHDPDFEVFIDPDGDGLNYIELEINELNTTWDLFITRPYRFNDANILHDWEIKGLKHAVHLRG
ncbi:MAG: carbohydrate-binding family 9-like protein, partial [Akkermansia sp.]|nr:carbohydrate-binding family 9-like protein [Akkermansia sp.]